MPIAAGEEWYTAYEVRNRLDAGPVAVLQPEMGHTGITQFRRIAALAAEQGASIAPHATIGTGFFLAASLQVSATLPHLWKHEWQHSVFARNLRLLDSDMGYADGAYLLPTAPGLGAAPQRAPVGLRGAGRMKPKLNAQPNKSLIDGITTLQALATSPDPVGSRELARRLDIDPVKVNRLLKTLAYLGIARQTADRKYTAGPGMHVLAAQSLFASGLIRHALPVLENLRRFGHTVALGVLWQDNVSYLFHAPPGIEASRGLGRIGLLPATTSGIGIVLLSEYEDDDVRELYAGPRAADVSRRHRATARQARRSAPARLRARPRCRRTRSSRRRGVDRRSRSRRRRHVRLDSRSRDRDARRRAARGSD